MNEQYHDQHTLTLTLAGDAYEYYLDILVGFVDKNLALAIDGQDVQATSIEHDGTDVYDATEASILAHPYIPEKGYDRSRTVSIPLIRDGEVVVRNIHLF